jgi:arylsulfatase A-like enzyme
MDSSIKILAFLAALAWFLMGAAPQPAPVILISIDTLRADHLSAYGYRKLKTPNIDSYGQVFTDINSQIPLTLPSHTALMTSTYPFENGVEENAEQVPAGAVTLASVLKAHGYQTAAFVGSNMLDKKFGLDAGFDEYDSPFGQLAPGANPYSSRVRRDGALVLRAATSWLNTKRNQPVFLFVHLFDLHAPYKLEPPRVSNEPDASGYDAEIAYVDQLLGRFKQTLEQNGWWKKSLVVLLADHGESLGDHGEMSHGYFIYESTLHVPLLLHLPEDGATTAQRVTAPGGLVDVAPTILDALHLPIPATFEGASLLTAKDHEVYSESLYARDSFHWAALRSLRRGRLDYIDAPHPELYDLQKDPTEQSNLAQSDAADAARLRAELSRLMAKRPHTTSQQSNAMKNDLGSLGYLAAGSRKTSLREGPDPKDKLQEFQLFDQALDAMYSQRLETAIKDFRQILAEDRDNLPAMGNLGDAYLRAGKPDEAIRQWTAALQADPDYAPAAQALGEYYLSQKNYAKAKLYLQKTELRQ